LLKAPVALDPAHDVGGFDSGEPVLDDWLRRRALRNQDSGASRTFVVVDQGGAVQGYYALAAGAVDRTRATGAVRRNMPDPIPVLVLGRLAVALTVQGQGLGADLLRDAVLRSARLAGEAGIRALVVHALHEPAKRFYLHHGFGESAIDPLVLMLRIRSN